MNLFEKPSPKRPLGLQTEIFLNLAVLVSVALFFSCLLWVRFAETELISQRINLAQDKMQLLLGGLASSALFTGEGEKGALDGLQRVLRGYFSGTEVLGWSLYDPNLQRVAEFNGPAMAPASKAAMGLALLDGELRINVDYAPFSGLLFFRPAVAEIKPLRMIGSPRFRREGVVVVDFSLRDIPEQIGSRLLSYLGYGIPAALIVIGFGIFLLGKNVVRPLRKLDASTQLVASGDMEQRVEAEGPGEVFSLAESFNAMIASLREKRQETERQVRLLEAVNADLRETRQELVQAEKMASIGQLAAGLAHEVGNPLGAVQGYLEILRGEAGSDFQKDVTERSLKEVERINRLVRDLLDYASPRRPKEHSEPFDPAPAAREAREIILQQNLGEGISIEDRLPESLPAVRMPRHQLVQVILNLLMNARDASTGPEPILIEGGEHKGEVWLSVSDRGEGIPEAHRAQLFDPFFSTKAPGKGRGLGLAVCRGIVTATGGRIEVASRHGGGTTFRVVLRTESEGNDGL